MMELRTIEMSGDEIPMMCNLGVLEELQTEFGTIQEFVSKLAPLDKNGEVDFSQAPADWLPDIHALVYALPRMINEGIEVHNETQKVKIEKMTPKEIFRRCDLPIVLVSAKIYNEVMRSLNAPKQEPPAETTHQ